MRPAEKIRIKALVMRLRTLARKHPELALEDIANQLEELARREK